MGFSWHRSHEKQLLDRREQLPHALLLRGPQGIGKLAFAEALAGALLCEEPDDGGAACGHCASCLWMGQGTHPDLRRLEPESAAAPATGERSAADGKTGTHITVESVRSVADFINMSSHRGKAKVVLIHPAEALNVNAANALLKSLEEPPPQTYFLLVAHRWRFLSATITSRCRHVALQLPDANEAREWLAAQGSPNPGLALADAGGAPLQALKFDAEYQQQRGLFFKTLTRRDFDALEAAAQFYEMPPALVVGWLQKWAYDLFSHHATGRVRYNVDLAEAVASLAPRVDPRRTARFLRHLVGLQRIVLHPLNARLFSEQLFLTYADLVRGRPLNRAA